MYADAFGLRELPFNNTPDPRFFFSTPDYEEALASVIYTIGERKGFMLLTGEAGTGKTFIAKLALGHFGRRVISAHVCHPHPSADQLLASVCIEFGLEVETGEGAAHLASRLQDFLVEQYEHRLPVVLILDEAQNLTVEALEALRLVGNIESPDAKLVQLILIGQPELCEKLDHDNLRQLSQRLFRKIHLPTLTLKQTKEYIHHRLSIAGATDEIFDDSAIGALHEISGGIPRVINTIADAAMLGAYSSDRQKIDASHIRKMPDVRAHTAPKRPRPRRAPAPPPPQTTPPPTVAIPTTITVPIPDSGMSTRIASLENKILDLSIRDARAADRTVETELAAKLTAIEHQLRSDDSAKQSQRSDAHADRITEKLASVEQKIHSLQQRVERQADPTRDAQIAASLTSIERDLHAVTARASQPAATKLDPDVTRRLTGLESEMHVLCARMETPQRQELLNEIAVKLAILDKKIDQEMDRSQRSGDCNATLVRRLASIESTISNQAGLVDRQVTSSLEANLASRFSLFEREMRALVPTVTRTVDRDIDPQLSEKMAALEHAVDALATESSVAGTTLDQVRTSLENLTKITTDLETDRGDQATQKVAEVSNIDIRLASIERSLTRISEDRPAIAVADRQSAVLADRLASIERSLATISARGEDRHLPADTKLVELASSLKRELRDIVTRETRSMVQDLTSGITDQLSLLDQRLGDVADRPTPAAPAVDGRVLDRLTAIGHQLQTMTKQITESSRNSTGGDLAKRFASMQRDLRDVFSNSMRDLTRTANAKLADRLDTIESDLRALRDADSVLKELKRLPDIAASVSSIRRSLVDSPTMPLPHRSDEAQITRIEPTRVPAKGRLTETPKDASRHASREMQSAVRKQNVRAKRRLSTLKHKFAKVAGQTSGNAQGLVDSIRWSSEDRPSTTADPSSTESPASKANQPDGNHPANSPKHQSRQSTARTNADVQQSTPVAEAQP